MAADHAQRVDQRAEELVGGPEREHLIRIQVASGPEGIECPQGVRRPQGRDLATLT